MMGQIRPYLTFLSAMYFRYVPQLRCTSTRFILYALDSNHEPTLNVFALLAHDHLCFGRL